MSSRLLGTLVVRIAAELARYKADLNDAGRDTQAAAQKIEQSTGQAAASTGKLGEALGGLKQAAGEALGALKQTAGAAEGDLAGAAQGAQRLYVALGLAGAAAGVLAAGVAVAAKAHQQGAAETKAYEKSLIMTGNAAGTSAAQMADMARGIASVVGTQAQAAAGLAQMAASGQVAGADLARFTEIAVAMERTTGQSVGDTVKHFAELGREPVKASQALNESMNYLTAATYEQVKAAQDNGDKALAASIAQDAYAAATKNQTAQIEASLGTLAKAWRVTGEIAGWAWDKFADIGRSKTPQAKISEAQAAVEDLQRRLALPMNQGVNTQINLKEELLAAQAVTAAMAGQGQQALDTAKSIGEYNAVQKAGIDAVNKLTAANEGARSAQQKSTDDLAKYREQVEALRKAREGTPQSELPTGKNDLLNPDTIAATEAAIIKRGETHTKTARAMVDENAKLLASVREGLAASQAEVDLGRKLTPVQREIATLYEKIGLSKHAYTLETLLAVDGLMQEKLANEAASLAREAGAKASLAAAEAHEKFVQGLQAGVASLQAQVLAQEEHNDRLGLGRTAIAELDAAKLADQATTLQGIAIKRVDRDLDYSAYAITQQQTRELLKLAAAKRAGAVKADALDAQSAADKALEHSIKKEEDARLASAKKIGDGLYDALAGGVESGFKKGFTDVKKWLARQIFNVAVEPFAQFGASLLNPGAAGGSTGNAALGLASKGLSLYGNAGQVASQVLNGGMSVGNGVGTVVANAAGTGIDGLLGAGAYGTAGGAVNAGVAAGAFGESVTTGAALAADYVAASTVIAEGAAVTAGAVGTAAGAAAGAGLTGALAAVPVYGWIALAALALFSAGGKSKPAENTGESWITYDANGKAVNKYDYSGANPAAGNTAADKVVAGLQTTYAGTAKALGIRLNSAAFSYGGTSGKNGEEPNFNLGGSSGGKEFLVKGEKLTDAALALASSRAVFAALQGSELPKYLTGVFDGIVAAESTQEQLKTAIATAQAFKGLHDQLEGLPFPALKDMSYATTAALVAASGGMQQFQQNIQTQYEKFVPEAEKNANTVANLTKTFGELGLTLPKIDDNARTAFRAMVDGQDLATEAGIRNKSALLGVAGAFDAVATYADNLAKDAVDAAKKTADAAKTAADELAKIEKEAADKHIALVREQQGWQDKLDVLTKKSTQTEVSERNDLAAASNDTIRAIIKQTYVQEALALATEKALEAGKKEVELAQARARARLDSVSNSASSGLAGVGRAVDAQKAAATAIYNARTAALQTTLDGAKTSLDAVTTSVGRLKSLAGSLKSTLDGLRIIGSEGPNRAAAQAQISAALATARNGGGLPLDGQLTSALATVSKPSEQLFATFQDYARDFYRTANDIADLSAVTDAQLTGDELTQALLKRQIDQQDGQGKTLRGGFDDQVRGLDDIASTARQQLDAANGIDVSVKEVRDALATFQASILTLTTERARQDLPTSRGVEYSNEQIVSAVKTSLQQGYKPADIYAGAAANYGIGASQITNATDAYGVAGFTKAAEVADKKAYSDPQILDAIKASLAAGFSVDDVYVGAGKNFGISSAEIARIGRAGGVPGFAGGGDHAGGLRVVGEQGMEIEATGPSRIFNASQTRDILQGGGSNNNEALLREMQALRDEVRGLRAEAQATTRHAAKTAGLLDRVTEGGRAMLTEAYS